MFTPDIDGTNIFDKSWDLLIILDGCQPEWFERVEHEYQWLPDRVPETIMSVGSNSGEWYKNTFSNVDPDVLSSTALITGNPYAQAYEGDRVPIELLGMFEDYFENGWDMEYDLVPPYVLTDASIRAGRSTDFSRYIVHYMQPHTPFFETGSGGRYDISRKGELGHCWDWWYAVMRGEKSPDELEEMYCSNLEHVLNEVDTLLHNFDADEAVITSDHTNLVGYNGMYGHPGNVPLEKLRRVPWIRTTAEDTGEISPDKSGQPDSTVAIADKLRALGYK